MVTGVVISHFEGRLDVNDYSALRDFLAGQTVNELTLTFAQIEEIIDDALPRAAQRASWWDSLRSPEEKRPQREACLAAGFVATRAASGDAVKFKRLPKPRKAG
jgi:hypothetical protein